ncbi:5-formyltetrahydrofolate cyclo-ligase [Methanimicrococcus hongohii]|uniref:5-formyltetrahydrofolate cyclo-ligase n=1 Tax=Methanimicrococcus hongohii TaxID=3028295 RepID=A0AA96V7H3_9EURY|nr:5-formyltetrahydrofolate cyclo-ligase [Methanimicrococcus sp. Hf6]WNY22936.1 5-formyltetrahydrofolate cyclo-ligase [Methanimicrococcus sp. Hf6]
MKHHFRQFLRAKRDSLTQAEVIEKSKTITDALIRSDLFEKSSSLFAYLDVRNEVHTRPLIEYCFGINKPVFVPVTRDREMFFTQLHGFSDLVEAGFGISEPAHPIAAEPDEKSLFIIPGVGFDECGNRIGYGAGFYDKYLHCRNLHRSNCRSGMHLVGICFEIQMADELPKEETDVQMDSVLTENKWRIVGKECR